ncbi:hypothetical protein [Nocardia africana]|uniref:LPXTG cell wall anchor domain-containing protein n=1 Tax=Nocardia africana TaxID=134964 RepID=A0ABW6NCF6_9NOCA
MSARRGRTRPGRYRNPHFHGYHSTSATPILAVLGALVGGVVLLLVVRRSLTPNPPAPPTTPRRCR